MRAIRNRNDLDIASVEIANWAGPGSIIGSLYVTNNRTSISYDVPLRDSGPYRSMTGAYPWRIDADYKSIAYVTNVTDDTTEFVVELAYDGGKFILGSRKIQPHETAVFDVEEIRNAQLKDTVGHVLPSNVSHGQFKWAQRGATNGKIMLIGRTEMVSRIQNTSSSYSCPMDCGPTYEATVDFPTQLFEGESGAGSVRETASWNYGYTMGPYPASATWSLDNSIAEFDPSEASDTTITGVTPGTANLRGNVGVWERYVWDGLNCIDVGPQSEEGGGPMDVPSPEVQLTNAKLYELTASFVGTGSTTQVATLNAYSSSHSDEICGDSPQEFIVRVNFLLPQGGQLVESRCSATAFGIQSVSNNYNVGVATCQMDNGLAGHLSFPAHRRCCGGPDDHPSIRFTIGANKQGQTGTIDTPGTVRILCNQ